MADPAVDLWASDEVHFQQHGSRCRMGVPPETKDPILLHHPARRSAGYFGAVRLRDGRFWSCRETGKFNAETFWEFMKQLQQVSRMGGRRVAVIADNARYHHARLHKAWREENAPGFELDYLPPYSPGLNPIASLEADPSALPAQPLLCDPGGSDRSRGSRVCHVGQPNDTLRRLCAII